LIQRYTYAAERKEIKNGKEIKIPIHPRTVLIQTGAFLQVNICPPRNIIEKLETEGKTIPRIAVMALIDTGALSSIVTPDVAEKAELIHTGYKEVTSVQNSQRQPEYFGTIMFPWNRSAEVPIVACPLKVHQCLIGRDILQYWYLTYDGQNGTIVICD
jgi:predicted aspartyl protease